MTCEDLTNLVMKTNDCSYDSDISKISVEISSRLLLTVLEFI